MCDAKFTVPFPDNEPILDYAPDSTEKQKLMDELHRQHGNKIEIPLIIGGKEVKTGRLGRCVCPHDHQHVLAEYHKAEADEVEMAIEAALAAKEEWAAMPWNHRAAIFLKAAQLISTKYRYILNAATMLNQSKNPFQAEIDSACELADFYRFNAFYMEQIYEEQPIYNPIGIWNRLEYRPLEGFVFAVTPFNFTSIAGNLPTAPALMGNVVLWKPASTSVLSGYYLMQLFKEAGLPDGVINFIPGSGSRVGNPVFASSEFAGVHFTGSTEVFKGMWEQIGRNIQNYKYYPRIVGETGGKDFVFVHSSADPQAVAVALVRGAFEYQGQKCSAASRTYIPRSLWDDIKGRMAPMMEDIMENTGDVMDFKFFNAVIDEPAFDKTMGYIEDARGSDDADIVFGGNGDKSKGFFIEPTVILTSNPKYVTMREELFAPVLTVYVYEDQDFEKTLKLCDDTSPYALTGSIFATDRQAVMTASRALRQSAGNFYINDKPTGAVVGQQPFGGARGSGTNDKAGSHMNLLRWTSVRTIKETFTPPHDYRYPFME